uniref:Uncharacterized protein n=1 Tax=Meloidogyne enterolobii TaxID=390850 RepID=A0A6V7W047_MELEN|nr:unnamed protein product [Meloidogyne enterolobii]
MSSSSEVYDTNRKNHKLLQDFNINKFSIKRFLSSEFQKKPYWTFFQKKWHNNRNKVNLIFIFYD